MSQETYLTETIKVFVQQQSNMNIGVLVSVLAIFITTGFYLFTKKKDKSPQVFGHFATIPPKSNLEVVLKERVKLSHDTYNFIFELPNPDLPLGVHVGQHYTIHEQFGDEMVERKYTPTSRYNLKGRLEQVLKIYRPNVHPKFPDGGKMSYFLEQLSIGEKIKISGPHGRLVYLGNGKTQIDRKLEGGSIEVRNIKKFYMVAGGTGLTPMFQIIQEICSNPNDKTECYLLFANKTEEDILIRDQLEKYAQEYSNFKLFLTVDTPPENWKYFSGFVNLNMTKKAFSAGVSSDILCCSCGPLPMNNLARQLFLEMGFKEEQYFKF